MKLIKKYCEVCGEADLSVLDFHHITPRTDSNSTNDNLNLCILCSTCHRKSHSGSIKIIGLFPSTQLPNRRTLIYKMNGVKNLDIDEPYYTSKSKFMRLHDRS
jgi:translation initiation factor RLI1